MKEDDYKEEIEIMKKALDNYYDKLFEDIKNEIDKSFDLSEIAELLENLISFNNLEEPEIKNFNDFEKYVHYKKVKLLKNFLECMKDENKRS